MGLDNIIPDEDRISESAVCPNCQTESEQTNNNVTFACINDNCRIVAFTEGD